MKVRLFLCLFSLWLPLDFAASQSKIVAPSFEDELTQKEIAEQMKRIFGTDLRGVNVTPKETSSERSYLVSVSFNAMKAADGTPSREAIEIQMMEVYETLYRDAPWDIARATVSAFSGDNGNAATSTDLLLYRTTLSSVAAQKIVWRKIDDLDWKQLWKTEKIDSSLKE